MMSTSDKLTLLIALAGAVFAILKGQHLLNAKLVTTIWQAHVKRVDDLAERQDKTEEDVAEIKGTVSALKAAHRINHGVSI